MSYILAGAIQSRFIDPSNGNLIFTTRSLTEATFGISVTGDDIRGGLSNKLLGKYFHDSILNVTITDALFDLGYIASQVGGSVIIGGPAVTTETITTATANQITVGSTPLTWNNIGKIGWFSPIGENNWTKISFTGTTATVSGLAQGSTVCVKYIAQNDAVKTFTIPASIIPALCYLEVEGALFNASESGTSYTQSSRAGSLFVEVPKFLFNGSVDLTMSASGASTTNLSGTALASYTGTTCDDLGTYAKVTQVITGAAWDADLIAMGVVGGDFTVAANGTYGIETMGIYTGGATGTINPANLTYTVTPTGAGTINATTGVFTAGSIAQAGVIEIVDTTNTDITAACNVTVTA